MEKLIRRMSQMELDDEIAFTIINVKDDIRLCMGARVIDVFDSHIIVFGAFGGGANGVIPIFEDYAEEDDIRDELKPFIEEGWKLEKFTKVNYSWEPSEDEEWDG